MLLKTFPAILIASALLTSCRHVDVLDERGMTALMRAAQIGDTATMHRVLADGADVNAEVPRRDMRELFTAVAQMEDLPPSDIGFTALLYAAKSGRTRAAQILIANGADVRHSGRFGETALGFALKRSDVGMSRLLTGAGARVDARQFAQAVERASPEMVSLLLRYGGDPNGISPPDPMGGRHAEQPLLVTATQRGDPQVIKALIDARANLNIRDANGWTALRWARDAKARSNPRAGEVVALLEAAGARDDGGTRAAALFDAVEKKDLTRVREALRSGANPNARDKRSLTPIITAAYNGSSAIVAALAAGGAHVNLVPAHFGPTALTAAVEKGSFETVQALLDAGAKPDAVDGRGWSPLFVATSHRRSKIAALLLADSSRVDHWALRQAANHGDTTIVRMLLQHGGDPNVGAALYAAISGCHEADNTPVIRMLLEAGAMTKTRNGFSVLHRAASRCQPEALRLLMDAGADPDERDFAGSAPLFYAAAAGKLENVRVLIGAGADLDATDRQGRTLEQRAWRHAAVRQEIQRARDSLRTRSQ